MPSEPVKLWMWVDESQETSDRYSFDKHDADDAEHDGHEVTECVAIPATDYAAMQSRITRLEDAIKNTLKYMDRLDGMIGPFHPNDFGAAHLRAALEEK